MKVAAAIWNASQCYHVIYDKKKKKIATAKHHWVVFSSVYIGKNPRKNQNLYHQGQEWAKLQLALRLLWLAIRHLYRLHPLVLLQAVTLLAWSLTASPWMPSFALFYCTIRFIVFYFSLFFIYVCVKGIINLLQYSTIQLIVLAGYLTLLDLPTNWINKCALRT